jgi:hypothetical protein
MIFSDSELWGFSSEMKMKTLRVGIASYEEMKARTVAIARGANGPAGREHVLGNVSGNMRAGSACHQKSRMDIVLPTRRH